MSRPRILVVEDELIVGLDLQRRLEEMGYDVAAVVPSGVEALERASQADLVLMDIKLAGDLDGIEVSRNIRARFDVPIVFVTAFADEATTERVQDVAPYGYVVKPFRKEVLRAVVETALARHEMEGVLRRSEERLRAFFEQASDGIFIADVNGRYTDVNSAGCQMLGYSREEIVGRTILDLIPPQDVPRLWAAKEQLLAGGIQVAEWMLRRKDGTYLPVEVSAKILSNGCWQGFVRDISERKHEQRKVETRIETLTKDVAARTAELQGRDALMRAVVETAVDAIITIDLRGTIESFNPAAERTFGYSAAEAIGQNVRMLMPAPYRDEHDGYIARYLKTGEARIIGIGREVVGLRRNGTTFPMGLAISELARGKFAGVVRDLTERQKLERRLADNQNEERQHLAQELHDGLGGQMTGIGMLAQTLETQLAKEGSPLAARAHDLVQSVEDAYKILRSVTHGLMPVEAVPEGFMAALLRLAQQSENAHGIACRFVCETQVYLDSVNAAKHLFRIAQEAVNNAVRHAHARHIIITLTQDEDGLNIGVTDDGTGMKSAPKEHKGIGLHSMEQRAHLLAGRLSVRSREGRGTVVSCWVPRSSYQGMETAPAATSAETISGSSSDGVMAGANTAAVRGLHEQSVKRHE